jgi:hypothetical protein
MRSFHKIIWKVQKLPIFIATIPFFMELYQRVWAEQFLLTDEQKADIMAGKVVTWQDAHVRQNGPTRFHVLLHIVDMEKPVYENQWLVKVDGQTKILWDHEIKSKYLFSAPVATEEQPKPIQSEALRRFLERGKEQAKQAKQATLAEPQSPAQTEEPQENKSLLDEFMNKGTIMQPGISETLTEVSPEQSNGQEAAHV